MSEIKYVPGVCNIGPEEINRRRRIGWIGLVVTVLAFVILQSTGVDPRWRALLFLPAALSATGFLQAYFSFCTGFAQMGVFNFDSIGHTEKITDESSIIKDKRKGKQITTFAVIIGLIVAIVAVALK